MAYEVLARKWRPQKFADILGQEHIARTLQNAIKQNRVGHAYLFSGPRGIGKTTGARIFAKALNCEEGMSPEPCCECQSCREIAESSCLDVREIDGASHNKVEDVRDIRDNVQYAPARCRFKIYIIDEVHMLTPQAWNALLKTLEEPPSHVKFFFATTEAHKILATILSRCQRFDLKRVPVNTIAEHLGKIAHHEGVDITERALASLARAADGGIRDAQSIFDQMIAFCGGTGEGEQITEEKVIDVFGLASGSEIRELATAIAEHDVQNCVEVIQSLAERGRDLERVYNDLLFFMRNVLLTQVCSDPEKLLDVSPSELEDLKDTGRRFGAELAQSTTEAMAEHQGLLKTALNKRVYLEVALIRVMREAHSVQLDSVLDRLNQIRQEGPAELSADQPTPPPRESSVPSPAETKGAPEETTANGAENQHAETATPEGASSEDAATENVRETSPADAPDTHTHEAPSASPEETTDQASAEETKTSAAEITAPEAPPEPEAETKAATDTTASETDVSEQESAAPTPPDDFRASSANVATTAPIETTTAAPETTADPSEAASSPSETDTASSETTTTASENEPATSNPESDDTGRQTKAAGEVDTAPTQTPDSSSNPDSASKTADNSEKNSEQAVQQEDEEDIEPAELTHQLIEHLVKKTGDHHLKSYVQELIPVSYRKGVLQLAYDEEFPQEHVDYVLQNSHHKMLNETLRELLGDDKVKVLVKRYIEGLSDENTQPQLTSSSEVWKRVNANEFVNNVCKMFNGEIIDVRG